MKKFAIIVAGGVGSRMKNTTPKQYLEVAGMPILMHTIRQFFNASNEIQIITVISKEALPTWQGLIKKFNFDIAHKIVFGGSSRTESVRNGLLAINENNSLVAIHDGVRPCIDKQIIQKSYNMAMQQGTAITAVKLKDSIREMVSQGTEARDRSRYFLVQTPQTFQTHLIKEAYGALKNITMPDDASVAEASGIAIHLIDGDYRNIKVTTPEDLLVVQTFLEN